METRDRLIDIATRLFSERGFYGVSIAEIADEAEITKQSLLYHFGSKGNLYEAVIRTISQRTMSTLHAYQSADKSPQEQLEAFFMAQFERALKQPADNRVILRELMDNKQRAESVQDWILKPFLDGIAELVGRVPQLSGRDWEERFAFAYQIQGAIFYFMISIPTLENMYGRDRYRKIEGAFRVVVREQINRFMSH